MLKALEKDSARRYQSAALLRGDLHELRRDSRDAIAPPAVAAAPRSRGIRAPLRRRWPVQPALPDRRTIAVLPFADMSPGRDQEYFSDGIAEELLNLLARIPQLRVISRSSAFSYKGKEKKIAKVAQELNVAHILEGSVRKFGERVRISAQLIEARTESQLWSRSYDRKLDDIFAIQDEIAADVVRHLEVALLGAAPKVAEISPQAYSLVLQARQLRQQFNAEGWELSNRLYEQALAIEPRYAAAWTELAKNLIIQSVFALHPINAGQADVMLQRALAIDPDYAPALGAVATLAMLRDGDLVTAARNFERALEIEPANPEILSAAARLLASCNRLGQAIELLEFPVKQDPLNPAGFLDLAVTYLFAGRFDDAIDVLATSLRLSPGCVGSHQWLGVALLFKGEAKAALETIREEKAEYCLLFGLALAHHALGETAQSDSALYRLIENFGREKAYFIAAVLAYRNEADRAFAWLAKAVEYRDPCLTWILPERLFENLHADPRWLPLLESLGKLPRHLDAIPFAARLPP